MKKLKFILLLMISILLVTGCGTKTLKCTIFNDVGGSYTSNNVTIIKIDKNGIRKISSMLDISYTNSYLFDYGITIDDIKRRKKDEYKKGFSETSYKISSNGNTITIKTVCKNDCTEDYEETLGTKYSEIKKQMENGALGQNYTCK